MSSISDNTNNDNTNNSARTATEKVAYQLSKALNQPTEETNVHVEDVLGKMSPDEVCQLLLTILNSGTKVEDSLTGENFDEIPEIVSAYLDLATMSALILRSQFDEESEIDGIDFQESFKVRNIKLRKDEFKSGTTLPLIYVLLPIAYPFLMDQMTLGLGSSIAGGNKKFKEWSEGFASYQETARTTLEKYVLATQSEDAHIARVAGTILEVPVFFHGDFMLYGLFARYGAGACKMVQTSVKDALHRALIPNKPIFYGDDREEVHNKALEYRWKWIGELLGLTLHKEQSAKFVPKVGGMAKGAAKDRMQKKADGIIGRNAEIKKKKKEADQNSRAREKISAFFGYYNPDGADQGPTIWSFATSKTTYGSGEHNDYRPRNRKSKRQDDVEVDVQDDDEISVVSVATTSSWADEAPDSPLPESIPPPTSEQMNQSVPTPGVWQQPINFAPAPRGIPAAMPGGKPVAQGKAMDPMVMLLMQQNQQLMAMLAQMQQ